MAPVEHNSNPAASESQGAIPPPFIAKIYELVEDHFTDDVISWNKDGSAFIIWNSGVFASSSLLRHFECFRTKNFSLFVHKLHTYGVQSVPVGPSRWEFFHPYFRRGEEGLLCKIQNVVPSLPRVAESPWPLLTESSESNRMSSSCSDSCDYSGPSFCQHQPADSNNKGDDDNNDIEKERLKQENLQLRKELAELKSLPNNSLTQVSTDAILNYREDEEMGPKLFEHLRLLAASQAGATRKVASYFAQALACRFSRIYPQETLDSSFSEMCFYESCPYLKFAHFTANQAILEAFSAAGKVHVIDFGLKQGMQWPALMRALALRPGGPPEFRLSAIGPPQQDNTDALQEVGWKLAQLAETLGIAFEFRGYVCSNLADLEPNTLEIRPGESVAVNSIFELHRMLAQPGSIEKVLGTVKKIKPKIVTIVEQEANHNGPVFLDRFTEALHYYSSLFDSLEGSAAAPPSQDLLMSELYLGHQICNVVACEGADRVERHETLSQWRVRMGSAGFDPVHLGSNAFKQASMLLALFAGGDGYRVEENNGCLMLGWHTRPLIATSAWKLPGRES